MSNIYTFTSTSSAILTTIDLLEAWADQSPVRVSDEDVIFLVLLYGYRVVPRVQENIDNFCPLNSAINPFVCIISVSS